MSENLKITHIRRVNHRVWLEDLFKLITTAFIFVLLARLSINTGIMGITEDIVIKVIGTIGMLGYLFLKGLRLLEHDDEKYWIYTKIEESK